MIAEFLMTARYNQVLRILDDERRLILKGPLKDLAALVEKREKAIAELVQSENTLPEAFIVALRARAERNGRLLQASIRGIKSAAAAVESIKIREDILQTYTADGTMISSAKSSTTRDERA